jgi:hypothetical protein
VPMFVAIVMKHLLLTVGNTSPFKFHIYIGRFALGILHGKQKSFSCPNAHIPMLLFCRSFWRHCSLITVPRQIPTTSCISPRVHDKIIGLFRIVVIEEVVLFDVLGIVWVQCFGYDSLLIPRFSLRSLLHVGSSARFYMQFRF